MARLVGFLDPAPDAPGFLIPLFREKIGANYDLIQELDHTETIHAFRDFVPPESLFIISAIERNVEIGEPAIWAFKDDEGGILVGTADEMLIEAERLLRRTSLFSWPLARLELGGFRNPDRPDVELLQAAFRSVAADDGELAAEVWRDTEVFAPAVRQDINKYSSHLSDRIERNLIVMHLGNRLEVYVESSLMPLLQDVPWITTGFNLEAFGLHGPVLVRGLGDLAQKPEPAPVWRAIGTGGVARFVLRSAPFNGVSHDFGTLRSEQGATAGGSLKAAAASQFIGLCQSTPGQVEIIAREVGAYPPESYLRHLVNVRPFSFGSPSPRKTPLEALPELTRDFDHVWIIAGHRQRRADTPASQLTVTNAASRHVKSLLLSLQRRADLITTITAEGLPNIPSLNLFGRLRARKNWSIHDWARNLLNTMLTEDALLHTAQRIVALVPGDVPPNEINVKVAEQRYVVELVPDPRGNRSTDLVGWAIGVEAARRTTDELALLCIGLLEGYQWRFRGHDGGALLFEDEGEPLRVWPAYDAAVIRNLLIALPPPSHVDLIITWITIQPEWSRRAEYLGLSLIHYSDLHRWLAAKYGNLRFARFD
jgi:hypothetical protein